MVTTDSRALVIDAAVTVWQPNLASLGWARRQRSRPWFPGESSPAYPLYITHSGWTMPLSVQSPRNNGCSPAGAAGAPLRARARRAPLGSPLRAGTGTLNIWPHGKGWPVIRQASPSTDGIRSLNVGRKRGSELVLIRRVAHLPLVPRCHVHATCDTGRTAR